MDAILKAVEINSENAWSRIPTKRAFLSFLECANVHDASGFFSSDETNNEKNAKRIPTSLPTSLPISCLPTGAMKLSVDLDVDDLVLDVLKREDGEDDDGDFDDDEDDNEEGEKAQRQRRNFNTNNNNNAKSIDTLRLLILVSLRTKSSTEEKLLMAFRKMERKRGFGVTLEHIKEWIEDCEVVMNAAMKSYMRKEREEGLMEERNASGSKIERSASMARRKKMSLSLGELKKKEESTTHSLRWMRGKMEAHFKKYFQTHGVAMDFEAFTVTVSEILQMWSTEALDSVERAFKETKSYDSFSEKIDRAEALGGSGGDRGARAGEHRRQNSGPHDTHGHMLPSGAKTIGSRSSSKKLSRSESIIETVAKTLKKGVESTAVLSGSREGSLRESAGDFTSLTHHERALSDDRMSNLSNRSMPRSPVLSRQVSGSETALVGGGGGALGVNPNTIVSYLPQQYRHVIDGAFDVLGMSTTAHGGHAFATREGNTLGGGRMNDTYYYEEDDENDDADSAHMTEAQKRRRDLKSELLESEQEFIDVEKQQEGAFEDTTWKRLVAFFREVTIRLFLYNVVKLLLIIALLAGDAALCMFVVNRFGVVSGLGVVVIINLGFAGIFIYSMLKFQKREKGLRNMEFGHNWVRQTDHILQGNNVVVNSALKAAETAHKVEAMKDKVTSLNTATNNNKPSQSPSPMKNAGQKSHLDRFESAHERF
jgi:hypothetical protein